MNAPAAIDAADVAERADPRPRSAVSAGVGIAGLIGLGAWAVVARKFGMAGEFAALMAVLACGVPMILWSLIVDRVHLNPSTGIDWSRPPRPFTETIDISVAKLAGLWAIWSVIGCLYCVARLYWDGAYLFAMKVIGVASIPMLVLSIPYVIWLDRRLKEPRDGAWHMGQLLVGRMEAVDRHILYDFFRAWAVKGFFLAFMISIVPGNWSFTIQAESEWILASPVNLSLWLVGAMFTVDVVVATVGYVLTMKPLDGH